MRPPGAQIVLLARLILAAMAPGMHRRMAKDPSHVRADVFARQGTAHACRPAGYLHPRPLQLQLGQLPPVFCACAHGETFRGRNAAGLLEYCVLAIELELEVHSLS